MARKTGKTTTKQPCESGAIFGEFCDGAARERIRWVPRDRRGTATAAGSSRGLTEELHVCASCAGALVPDPARPDEDDEWIEFFGKEG